MQIMLNECTKFGIDYNIKFNPDKTKLIIFSKYQIDSNINCNLNLNNVTIKRVDCITQLGFKLHYNLNLRMQLKIFLFQRLVFFPYTLLV
jgi:hypothetical protein